MLGSAAMDQDSPQRKCLSSVGVCEYQNLLQGSATAWLENQAPPPWEALARMGRNRGGFEERACKGGGCGWSPVTPRGLTVFGFQTGSPCPTHPLLHKRHKKHTYNGGGISNPPLPSHPHPLLHVRWALRMSRWAHGLGGP